MQRCVRNEMSADTVMNTYVSVLTYIIRTNRFYYFRFEMETTVN